ncbi:protein phosphatase 2C domain-containing protein [Capilliphycus salinus ALCB114379]|uniref:protein phosphatase 2C domain-containing protein n=1 Tax=Capilliphycus salinus TaxID=2768948 RepID=UPI0039A5C952
MQNQHDYEKIIPEIVQNLRREGFFQTLSSKCKQIIEDHQQQNQLIDEVVKHLQEKLSKIQLKIPNGSNIEEEIEKFCQSFLDSLLKSFSHYQSEELGQIQNLIEQQITAKIREILRENLSRNYSETPEDLSRDSPPQQSLTNPESQQQNHSTISREISPWKPEETPSNTSQQQPEQLNKQASENFPMETTVDAPWEYHPIPQNEPAPHSEFDFKGQETPEKLKLVGARVRGKMHKHNGTNCDDWFEFKISTNWTIIAVSDGAGSKKLSRLGAKVSCQAAVQYLSEILKNCTIRQREKTENLSNDLQRQPDWSFVGQDFNEVQTALHIAVQKAYEAVKAKADDCNKLTDYYIALNHKIPEIKDFSATLLLAVHTLIKVAGESYSLVLSCQVGDGAIAAISQEGNLKLSYSSPSIPFASSKIRRGEQPNSDLFKSEINPSQEISGSSNELQKPKISDKISDLFGKVQEHIETPLNSIKLPSIPQPKKQIQSVFDIFTPKPSEQQDLKQSQSSPISEPEENRPTSSPINPIFLQNSLDNNSYNSNSNFTFMKLILNSNHLFWVGIFLINEVLRTEKS